MQKTVGLLTDFGTRDSYVAELKGVLLSHFSPISLVDITHRVEAFSIKEGAFHLLRSYSHFPPGTWFLAIVDPGVGSARKAVAATVGPYHFVGPDNGVLLWAVQDAEKRYKKKAKAVEIALPKGASVTFHGRDVFAPFIGASLSGKKTKTKRITDLSGTSLPKPEQIEGRWHACIIHCDHYGNLVTALPHSTKVAQARFKGRRLVCASSYDAISDGEMGLIAGSHGFWEIAGKQLAARKSLSPAPEDIVVFSA